LRTDPGPLGRALREGRAEIRPAVFDLVTGLTHDLPVPSDQLQENR
jgi:hypothetical protein